MEQDQVRGQSEVSTIGTGGMVNEEGAAIRGITEGEGSSGELATPQQSEDSTLSTTQSLEEAAKAIKRPIFIATAEGHIATAIERFLFTEGCKDKEIEGMSSGPIISKDQYVLLVVNPEIYNGLRQQYLFSLLKEDEQARAQQISINEELHQKALTQALQIEYFIKNHHRSPDAQSEENSTFNEKELRVILNKMKHMAGERGKLTHQDTWNIMDLLVLQGFLLVENMLEEIHTREKRKYKLVISDKDRLTHIQTQRDQCLYLQRKYKDQEDSLNNQINELENKINESL